MSDPFSSDIISYQEEEFVDDDHTTASGNDEQLVNPNNEIVLRYGTEAVVINLQDEQYAGKTLTEIAAAVSDELGFRDPNRLNYRAAGTFVEGSNTPTAGTLYTLSTSVDTKGKEEEV